MKDEDILEAACKRMQLAADADRENRELALDDLRNQIGEQWPDSERRSREAEGRPCLVINRLPQFTRQVTGDLRRMNPSINVLPASDDASKEGAEFIEGMIRYIQYRSDASSIYEEAGESAATCSMGYFRVLTDYEDDDTFNQEILIEGIKNPFAVYFDPDARLSTREDANWVFIADRMSEEDFKEAYPGKDAVSADGDTATDRSAYWREGDDVIVAEYFWKEPVEKTIWQLPGGEVVDTAPRGGKAKSRKVQGHKVMWAKISGADVLEGPQEWAGKYIPVVAVVGEEIHVADRVVRSSVIRYAKEPQRLYNYFVSAETEVLALQPKAPYMVTATQVSGFEQQWANANTKNRPYLVYKPDPNAPPPQRSQPPMASSGMLQHIMMAGDDMKATTGIYDAGLGQRSNEHSGVAIKQRQMESDISTSIYSDNVSKAVGYCGRIIVDLIPKIYDSERMVRIVGNDDEDQMVKVNQVQKHAEFGDVTINNLTIGKYDIRVSVGPNYTTKRQEAAENMLEFIRVFPQAAPLTADLIAGNMDWPEADKFQERLKAALPPGIADNKDPQAQRQQQAAQQAQMQEQQQQQQIAQTMQKMALDEQQAKTRQAVANADKAEAEAMRARAELGVSVQGLPNNGLPIQGNIPVY